MALRAFQNMLELPCSGFLDQFNYGTIITRDGHDYSTSCILECY